MNTNKMKRTYLQRNTIDDQRKLNTDGQSRYSSGIDGFHPAGILFNEQHFDQKGKQRFNRSVRMINIFNVAVLVLFLGMVSCESSEDISKGLDHEVPVCASLTLTANGQTVVVDDSIISLLLWGVVPQTNLETIVLPTITANPGSTIDISVVISDNDAIKTAEISYSDWLFSKYINFANPTDGIPLTPQSYTFTAQVVVPEDAVTTPWLESYYFNDGSLMKITQSYHEISLTVVDVNMNTTTIPIFVKIE